MNEHDRFMFVNGSGASPKSYSFMPKQLNIGYRNFSTKTAIDTVYDHERIINNDVGDDDAVGSTSEEDINNDESLIDHYESLIKTGEVTHDPHQIRALQVLDRLRKECLPHFKELSTQNEESLNNNGDGTEKEESWSMTNLFSLTPSWVNPSMGENDSTTDTKSAPKGVYLHGGVGCGKTYCMNLFYDSLPPHMEKQKVHFHKFMLNIHRQMHKAKMIHKLQGDAVIAYVIQKTLSDGKILCFDEFQVTDVADGEKMNHIICLIH